MNKIIMIFSTFLLVGCVSNNNLNIDMSKNKQIDVMNGNFEFKIYGELLDYSKAKDYITINKPITSISELKNKNKNIPVSIKYITTPKTFEIQINKNDKKDVLIQYDYHKITEKNKLDYKQITMFSKKTQKPLIKIFNNSKRNYYYESGKLAVETIVINEKEKSICYNENDIVTPCNEVRKHEIFKNGPKQLQTASKDLIKKGFNAKYIRSLINPYNQMLAKILH